METVGLLFWISVLFVFYTYLGYPLILTLISRVRRHSTEYPPFKPSVTFFITAYNEQSIIARKLENTLDLDYPMENLQILVVADGSDDRTVDIVRTFSSLGVELSYQPERKGKMAAINRALPEAHHEIIVFSDANNLYARDALNELVKPFVDLKVGAVSGRKSIIKGDYALSYADGLYWQYESYIKEQETRLGSCTGVSGEIFAIRKRLFRSPPNWIINDDFFIAMTILQQGYRVIYASKACSFEHGSLTESDEDKRRSRIVAGRYQAMLLSFRLLPWQNPVQVWQILSHKYLRPLVPLAMIATFVTNLLVLIWPPPIQQNAILYLNWPYSLIMFLLQLLFYLLASLGNNFKGAGFLGKILYLPTFLVNSNISAVRGCFSLLIGQQTSLWQRARRHGESVE